ncbi:hypothetical protein J2Z65_001561 [Paenibacillus aceris]|uniref:Uncharacterized protein n=1 Tax=Paenibacillus aceris TaxID=869555 RepID=A0ABS4HUP9_9BACL|nr:hypothetical protein [Paenibacillus aceris]
MKDLTDDWIAIWRTFLLGWDGMGWDGMGCDAPKQGNYDPLFTVIFKRLAAKGNYGPLLRQNWLNSSLSRHIRPYSSH